MANEESGPGASVAGAGRRKERETREAAALRANLLKRKAQQRGRDGAAVARPVEGQGDVAGDTPGGGPDRKGTPKAG